MMLRNFTSIFKEDIELYLNARKDEVAKSTYKDYYIVLSSFDKFLTSINYKEELITDELICNWLSNFILSNSSLNNYITVVRNLMNFRIQLGKQSYVPILRKKTDDYIPYIFDEKEILKIMDCADNLRKIKQRVHDRLIYAEIPMLIRLLYGYGFRVSEVLSLQVKNINFDTGVITIIHAKNDKQRLVPMHDSLKDILYQYCVAMNLLFYPDNFVFPSKKEGIPLKISSVEYYFSEILEYLGIDNKKKRKYERGPCVHCLRHTFVLNSFKQLESQGYSINSSYPYLSIYLGHNSIRETEKYMKFSSVLFDEEMDKFADFASSIISEVEL